MRPLRARLAAPAAPLTHATVAPMGKKKGRSEPRKESDELLSQRVIVKFTVEDEQEIRDAAKRDRTTLSEWIRRALREAAANTVTRRPPSAR